MLHPTKNESGEIEQVSGGRAFFHFLSIGWKVLFSIVPPPHMCGGWACFFVALAFIGVVVVIVGETATLFGCVVGLKDGLTAVTFVAIGTSLPDTFASKTAAQKERYADAAIGNITGSNCVNVFLGLGLPWMISTIYYNSKGTSNVGPNSAAGYYPPNTEDFVDGDYYVPQGSLTIAVITYLLCSAVGFIILIIRRVVVKGELGGSDAGRFGTAFIFTIIWIVYVIVVGLATYGYFEEPTTVA
jgi:solute carrier family 8 (sodium/calcium exchanger)